MEFLAENKPIAINEDSVAQVFVASFSKLGLPYESAVAYGRNYCEQEFFQHRVVRIRKIDGRRIKEIAGNTNGKTVLVPFIYINNAIRFMSYLTPSGMSDNDGFSVVTHVKFIAFIVKDNKVTYKKHFRYAANRVKTQSRQEAEAVPNLANVEQRHWDELVRRTMQDYVNRAK